MVSSRPCRIGLLPVVIAAFSLAACGSGGGPAQSSTPSASATPTSTPTLDPTALIHRYVTVLSADLAPLQSIDAACHSGADACNRAVEAQGAIAAKVVSDLQSLPAEPDPISPTVEDLRRECRFIADLGQNAQAGALSPSDAISFYTSQYKTVEHDLAVLQAVR